VHPVLFELFGYPVHLYAVMIATGFLMAVWLAVRHAERLGYDRDLILDLAWWMLVSGLVGSRIAFIAVNWDQYWYPCFDVAKFNQLHPDDAISAPDCLRLVRFWNGGLVFLGGMIGSLLTFWWFVRREKLKVLPLADAIIPYVGIGQFFGRFGCLAAGCCWGKRTDLPWGIRFPGNSMESDQQHKLGLLKSAAETALPIHPTQLYDALAGLLLFAILIFIRQRKRYHGQVLVWWLLLYSVFRSTIEVFRGDTERGYVFQYVNDRLNSLLGLPAGSATFLSTSQFISLGLVIAAVVLLYRSRRRRFASAPEPAVH
jgi:phosphatidylglycerol:prolipoprotein diacylglycerol transferase